MAAKTKKYPDSFYKHPFLKQAHEELSAIAARSGHNRGRIVTDWVELMFWAFQGNDEQYLQVMKNYDNSSPMGNRPADRFARALGCLIAYIQETNEEILGQIYMDFCSSDKLGQFFTPACLCQLIAAVLNSGSALPAKGPISIIDPACGAGAMLVADAQNMTREQLNRALFVGQDIDLRCCQMTALNMLFFNLNGVVVWGDSLRVEVRQAWETIRTPLGGILRPYDAQKAKDLITRPFNVQLDEGDSNGQTVMAVG